MVIYLSFFHNIASVPLFDRDEGAFSEATREMFERRDFISTYLDGKPRYDKPILIYWFQALGVILFGVNEFAFRFPSAVFAGLWLIFIFFFCKKYLDIQTAVFAAVIHGTSLVTSIIGSAATADALLNMLLVLVMFDIWRYYSEGQKIILYRVFLWMGLGFLTKGPIIVLIPFMVTLLFYSIQRRWKDWFKAVFNPVSILIFLAIILPWYIAQYLKEGQAFIDGFFLKHNVNRFASPMENHGGAIFYYIPVLLIMLIPHTSLLIRTFERIRFIFRDKMDMYLWLWFLFVFVFFSISGTKLPHYMLYGCTPLFILMARYRKKLKSSFLIILPALLFILLVLILPYIIPRFTHTIDDELIRNMLKESSAAFDWQYYFWSILPLVLLIILPFIRVIRQWQIIIPAGLLSLLIFTNVLFPVAGEVMQEPIKEAALIAKEKNYNVVMWGMIQPSFSVYRQKITKHRRPEDGEIAITKVELLKEFGSYTVLYKRGGLALVHVEKSYPESQGM
ncbi:glycosyltransferase family 39 protein [Candidatus Poribacteria bacterium]|nr:glycosyltransferase family 39 protein [Candidatus Poribacteria bacterium]